MKVYLYQICYDDALYAYTLNDEYASLFESQRDMSLFKKSVARMDKYEWMMFSNKHKSLMLIMDVLFDGETDIDIACTISESDRLSSSSEYIDDTCTTVMTVSRNIPYNDTLLKSIMNLTRIITSKEDTKSYLRINTFKLFYHLFKFTFEYKPGGEDYLKNEYEKEDV